MVFGNRITYWILKFKTGYPKAVTRILLPKTEYPNSFVTIVTNFEYTGTRILASKTITLIKLLFPQFCFVVNVSPNQTSDRAPLSIDILRNTKVR